jgi:uncharacterized protein (TIGR03382 family)
MGLVTGSGDVADGTILGVVADSDIYNGTRLAGATVWIGETGATATSDSSGIYRFYDVPLGSYTIHATYPGYAEATCVSDLSGSEDWCSIPLFPSSGGDNGGDAGGDNGDDNGGTGGETGGETGGDNGSGDNGGADNAGDNGADTGTADNGGPTDPPDADPGPRLPGRPVSVNEVGGCSSAPGPAAGWLVLAGLVVAAPLSARRRRPPIGGR